MRDVFGGAAQGDWQVVVPGVVVDEAVRQYPARLRETLKETRRVIAAQRSDLQALGLPLPDPPNVDEDALIAGYEAELRATLSQAGCTVADPPTQTELVGSWAATRRSPFKEDATGTSDAFVWLTVLDQAQDDDVILVSANSHDFGDRDDPTRLAPALLQDLEERDIAVERVRRVDNIHQLLVVLRTSEQQALQRARALLGNNDRKQALIAQISLQASWTPGRWDAIEDWNLRIPVEEFTLRAFDADPDQLNLESATIEDDGSLTMLLTATGAGSFDFFVDRTEVVHAPDDSPVEVYDPDWSDWYAWAEATLPATAEVDVRVREGDEYEISIESLEPA